MGGTPLGTGSAEVNIQRDTGVESEQPSDGLGTRDIKTWASGVQSDARDGVPDGDRDVDMTGGSAATNAGAGDVVASGA